MKELVEIAAGSLLGAFLVTWASSFFLLRGWTWKRGFGISVSDGLNRRQPELRVGGLAVFAGLSVCFVWCDLFSSRIGMENPLMSEWVFILAGAIFLLGFADDLFRLPGAIRLGVQIGIGVCAYNCGMRIETMSNPVTNGSFELGEFGLVLTVLWFVALPNLVALIDSMDGVAGGVGLFLCLTLSVLGLLTGNIALAALSLGLAGGLLAFLFFNLPPARMYLGKGGAFVIGYHIAALSLITSNKGSIVGPMLVVLVVLGFPILDTVISVFRRGLSGLPLLHVDGRNLHHRLLNLGFSKQAVLVSIYLILSVFSTLGIVVFVTQGNAFPVVGMVLSVFALIGFRFAGMPRTFSGMKEQLRDILASRSNIRYAHTLARVLEHDVARVDSEELFWERFAATLARLRLFPATTMGSETEVQCSADSCLLVFQVSQDEVINLCVPRLRSGREEWDRVFHCFLPVISGAKAKWGRFPETMGFARRGDAPLPANLPDEGETTVTGMSA